MWVVILLWQSHSEYKRGVASLDQKPTTLVTKSLLDTSAIPTFEMGTYTLYDTLGRWVGVGTVGYTYAICEKENGNILHITILDHGSVSRFFTISAFANSISMNEGEVKYFMLRFFEWVKLE